MLKKRLVAAALTGAMMFGVLSGCGNSDKSAQTATPSGSASAEFAASETPLELSFFYAGVAGSPVFKDDYPVFQEAAKLTNITLKGSVPQSVSNADQVFVTMMSSGQLDDIISASKSDFDKYSGQGAFLPLEDLIDQYAPHIKQFLEENPYLKKELTSTDGHIYYLPRVERGDTAKGWYIRKDWLKKLNLEEPKTVDEFYAVMKAFKEQDPNGNGIADEVPYFDREGNLKAIYNLFGIRDGFSLDEETGKIVYGRCTPEFKEAVKTAAQWYAEGLIDQEIFTRGGNSREYMLGDNIGGITHDWFTSTSLYNEKLRDKIPEIDFSAMAPPADSNGEVWEDTSRANNSLFGWGISVQNEHVEETMKYFDFWFTEAGYILSNYGVEGEHYTMVDGVPTFTPEFLDSDKSMTVTFYEQGIGLYIGSEQDFNAERQWMTEDALESINLYLDNNYIKQPIPRLSFTEEEQKVISEKLTAVTSYIDEQEQKWIFGNESVDATFDAYLQKCSSLGMDEIVEIYNTAYERFQNS
ncbi:extracellular solute-binding protein [Ructibacterium gallinarum]|uniref:Extracellular solute-binding protein n=1 Tax=Ructibacterium gallinarum TaxID=2779355 RepID=A0A9D5RCP0_9FIRM|nr:extracellular solute-binding protein [Ructibacterium gallinarum]MBE5041173.1 extracellular solute-binding protein [Ructibacterium gallinarum]